jgi:hypothetical protein
MNEELTRGQNTEGANSPPNTHLPCDVFAEGLLFAVEMAPIKNREWTATCGAPNEVPARDMLDFVWPAEDLTDTTIA